MTTEIQKTETPESQALQNAISGKVHDIPSPGPCWANVEFDNRKFCFDLNDAPQAMVVLKLLKENSGVFITHRKDWQ